MKQKTLVIIVISVALIAVFIYAWWAFDFKNVVLMLRGQEALEAVPDIE